MKMKNFFGMVLFLIVGMVSTASYAYGTDTWWWDQVRAGNHGVYNNWQVPAFPSANYPDSGVKKFPNNYYPYFEPPNKCGSADSSFVPDHFGGSANFSTACNNHDICYMTLGVDVYDCNIQFASDLKDECEDAYAMFRAAPGATTPTSPGHATAVRVTLSNGTVLNLLISDTSTMGISPRFCPGCSLNNIKKGLEGVVDGVFGAVNEVGGALHTSIDIVVDGVTQTFDATVDLAEHTIEIAGVVYEYTVAVIQDPTLRLAACLAVSTTMTSVVVAATPIVFPDSQQKTRRYLDWVYGENNLYLVQSRVMVPIFSLLLD